jgi:hypothetical protein
MRVSTLFAAGVPLFPCVSQLGGAHELPTLASLPPACAAPPVPWLGDAGEFLMWVGLQPDAHARHFPSLARPPARSRRGSGLDGSHAAPLLPAPDIAVAPRRPLKPVALLVWVGCRLRR